MKLKLIFSFLLGAVTVLGFAPFYYFPVPVFTLALLFYLWRNSARPFHAAMIGFAFGMGLFGVGVSWIYVSLHDFGNMPIPLAVFSLIILFAYLSLFPALTGWISAKFNQLKPLVWLLVVTALWMLSEWLRGTLFTGFPWLLLGYSQVPHGPWAGYAPVMGVYGVSLILALSAALLVLWFEQGLRVWRYGLSLGLILLGSFGLHQVDWVKPEGEPLTVSLLQGNIAQEMKWHEGYMFNSLDTYARLIQESNSRLIVTPEVSLPLFHDVVPPAYLASLVAHARKNNADLLVGMNERNPNDHGEYYNTMFSYGVSGEQMYRKHHLVPFGEFVPLKPVFHWIASKLNTPMSDFSRGRPDQQPMDLAGQRVAINICYEDVFGEEIINQLPQATLLVNVSNDAWFGRSIGPHQHLQISQMRALESGRYMLRATNTGLTAIINERGAVLEDIEVFTTAALHGVAQGFTGATPYVRFGNYFVLGLAGMMLLMGLLLTLMRRPKK